MDNILNDLREADKRGVAPPQNWTTRAADRIEKLEKALRYVLEDEGNLIPRASSSCRGHVRGLLDG